MSDERTVVVIPPEDSIVSGMWTIAIEGTKTRGTPTLLLTDDQMRDLRSQLNAYPKSDAVPKIAVRHADERWPDTEGEPIPMSDARQDATRG